ncbi:hypothetical protein PR048_016908 [Dryococelus australis]|uniref:Uncharacterized protein n=1 Tax=Dryococelus australis TaxID=614101 RepID=A0ABQ9H838_9NEOP|nr:hypothetical protein PR048_016908 [Dryococelus australis]
MMYCDPVRADRPPRRTSPLSHPCTLFTLYFPGHVACKSVGRAYLKIWRSCQVSTSRGNSCRARKYRVRPGDIFKRIFEECCSDCDVRSPHAGVNFSSDANGNSEQLRNATWGRKTSKLLCDVETLARFAFSSTPTALDIFRRQHRVGNWEGEFAGISPTFAKIEKGRGVDGGKLYREETTFSAAGLNRTHDLPNDSQARYRTTKHPRCNQQSAIADLPWRSRLVRHRFGMREALGSNPVVFLWGRPILGTCATAIKQSTLSLVTKRDGAVVTHWTCIREDPCSISGPVILVSRNHSRRMLGWVPNKVPWPIPSPIPLPCATCTVSNDLAVDETLSRPGPGSLSCPSSSLHGMIIWTRLAPLQRRCNQACRSEAFTCIARQGEELPLASSPTARFQTAAATTQDYALASNTKVTVGYFTFTTLIDISRRDFSFATEIIALARRSREIFCSEIFACPKKLSPVAAGHHQRLSHVLEIMLASYSYTGSNVIRFNSIALPHIVGATVPERLEHSSLTKANRVQSPTGSPDFRKWESCRTMPLVTGFSRRSPSPSFTLIGSQDIAVKSRPNLFTLSLTCCRRWHVHEGGANRSRLRYLRDRPVAPASPKNGLGGDAAE